ncbi:MAG: GNAT family N-acetyltransferase [Candidatus Bathyarchaeia archaeon]
MRTLKAGAFIRRFTARDGREVTLRAPRWSDLDDMLEFINSLVEEGAEIMATEKKTREEEVDWLSQHLSALEKGEKMAIAAEVDGRFVGQVEVRPRSGYSRHVGVLGIAISDGYRDIGVGTELMREAETQARGLGMEIMTLEVFASNGRARHLYEKLGYRVVGREPKAILKDGAYIDNIIMAKELGEDQ